MKNDKHGLLYYLHTDQTQRSNNLGFDGGVGVTGKKSKDV
ncbi:hypothetical protein OROMI_011781 [Orobanche minor]